MTRAAHEVHAGRLIGVEVRDATGARLGRLAEILAQKNDEEIVVSAYLVGPVGWIHRFAIHGLGLRLGSLGRVYRINWDQMDLSDPAHPRTTCDRRELSTVGVPPRKRGLTRRPGRRLA
jgi:hypothetical protein